MTLNLEQDTVVERSLEGKRAFVAGGTAGIGLAVAQAYVAAGAGVVIGGRREDGAAIARENGCGFVTLDVADETSMQAALAEELDVLVLNAGIGHRPASIADTSERAARKVVDTNLLGTFWGLKYANVRDGGSIIITSSISAVTGTPFEGLYGATKAGVSALARSAAIDLGPRGITVNAIQPGPVWTDLNPMPEALIATLAPLGRKGRVEDVVGLFVLLASDAGGYITGQAISVDGGITAGMSQALLGKAFA